MKPGEFACGAGTIRINEGRPRTELTVRNASLHSVGVGSHYHFAEVSEALTFDRGAARGLRLDVPSGDIVWFEPGVECVVRLIPYAGDRQVWGFRGTVNGPLDHG